jgi:hypothetical protein
MKKKGMTHKEHLEVAKDLYVVAYHLNKITEKCWGRYPKVTKILKKIHPGFFNNLFANLCGYLENAWYEDTTREERSECDFIYYAWFNDNKGKKERSKCDFIYDDNNKGEK